MSLKTVEQALAGLAQLFRLSRMYPESHPAVASSLTDMSAALPGLVERGPVDCRIKPQGWFWANASVLPKHAALTQLAQLLYSRGVRTVTFTPGVTLDDVKALIRVATGHLGPDDPLLGRVVIGHSGRRSTAVRPKAIGAAQPGVRDLGRPRTTGVFQPDALPAEIEARRLLPPFAVGGDPVERLRALKRLRELAPEVRDRRDPALTAQVLAALDRCVSDPRDQELQTHAREVVAGLVDDGLLATMVRRLGESRLVEEERQPLIDGLAVVIDQAGTVMADAYLGASSEGRAAYLAVMRAAGERGVFPLLKRLAGSGPDIAAAAADLLGASGSATAYERLARAARDESPLVRARASRHE